MCIRVSGEAMSKKVENEKIALKPIELTFHLNELTGIKDVETYLKISNTKQSAKYVMWALIAPLARYLGYYTDYEIFWWKDPSTREHYQSPQFKEFIEKEWPQLKEEVEKRIKAGEPVELNPYIEYAKRRGAQLVVHIFGYSAWADVIVWFTK